MQPIDIVRVIFVYSPKILRRRSFNGILRVRAQHEPVA